jgi:GNAT superfamily N-acetyltransferase
MKWRELFDAMHPCFFEEEEVRGLDQEDEFVEQIMLLKDFSADAASLPCPEGITFGIAEGRGEDLAEAVAKVDEDWVQYFGGDSPVFCAFENDMIVSFCCLDDMGTHQGLRISGPGCVGTIPECRGRGIGLRMVQLATEYLKQHGYDASYIHFTHIGHWYAKLGYETILKWNRNGIHWAKDENA